MVHGAWGSEGGIYDGGEWKVASGGSIWMSTGQRREGGRGGKCDAVAWLRELGQARWSVAGTRLLREAKGAGDVSVKHVSVFSLVSCYLFALGGVDRSDQWALVYA